jgi:hypothetical protein
MASTAPAAFGPPPAKRKAPAAGLAASGRSVKRRASRACHCCRSRKVRCDVVESGTPCTNCRLDEVECMVSDSKRRKRPRADGEGSNPSPGSSNDSSEELPGFNAYEETGVRHIPATLDEFLVTGPSGCLDFEMDHHVPHMLCMSFWPGQQRALADHALDQTQGHRLTREERVRRMSSISQPPASNLPSPVQIASNPYFTPQRPQHAGANLPSYIRALPPRILADDIDYLQRKGALTVPDTRLRNELLRSYVQYVHPYMPLVDLKDFLHPIERNDGNSPVSLLLFQAVMFAASAYLDMRFLHAQGFDNRKAARKIFFQRARVRCAAPCLKIIFALMASVTV